MKMPGTKTQSILKGLKSNSTKFGDKSMSTKGGSVNSGGPRSKPAVNNSLSSGRIDA